MGKLISRMLLSLLLGISIGFFIKERINRFFEETSTTNEGNIASEDQEPDDIERFVDKIKKIIYLWQKLYKSEIYHIIFPNNKNDQYTSHIEYSRNNETPIASVIKHSKVGTYTISAEEDINKILNNNNISGESNKQYRKKGFNILQTLSNYLQLKNENYSTYSSIKPNSISNFTPVFKKNPSPTEIFFVPGDMEYEDGEIFYIPKVFRQNGGKNIINKIKTSTPSSITLEMSDANKFKSSSSNYETYLFDCTDIVNTTARKSEPTREDLINQPSNISYTSQDYEKTNVTKNFESLTMHQFISSFSAIPERLADNEPFNYKSSSPTYETYFFDCSDIVNSTSIISEKFMEEVTVATSYNDSKTGYNIDESAPNSHKSSGFTDNNSEGTRGKDKKISESSTPTNVPYETYFFDCLDIVNTTTMEDFLLESTSSRELKNEHNLGLHESNDLNQTLYNTPEHATKTTDSSISFTSTSIETSFFSESPEVSRNKYPEKDKMSSPSYETYYFECSDIGNLSAQSSEPASEEVNIKTVSSLSYQTIDKSISNDLNMLMSPVVSKEKSEVENYIPFSTPLKTYYSLKGSKIDNDFENTSKQATKANLKDTTYTMLHLDYGAMNSENGKDLTSDYETYNTIGKSKTSAIETYKPMSTKIENTTGQTSETNLKDTTFLTLVYETQNLKKGDDSKISNDETYSTDIRKDIFVIENNNSTSTNIEKTTEQLLKNIMKDKIITDLPLDYEILNSAKNHKSYSADVSREISVFENNRSTSKSYENTSGHTPEKSVKDKISTDLPLHNETLNSTKVGHSTSDQETNSTGVSKEMFLIQNNKSTSASTKNTFRQTSENNLIDSTITDLPLDYETLNSTKVGYSTSNQEIYPTSVIKEISVTENYIPTSRITENTSGQTAEGNLIDTSITNLPLNYETLNLTKVEYFTIDQETYSTNARKELSLIQNNKSTSADIKNTSGPTSEKRVKDKSTTDLPLHYEILNTTTSDQETYPTGTLKEISVTENYIPTSRIIENTSGQTSESNLIDTSITNLPLNYETLNSTKVEYFTSDQETYSKSVIKEWSLIQNNKSTSADIKNTSGPTSEKRVKDKSTTDLPLHYKILNTTTSDQETYPTGTLKEISVTENYIPTSRIIENTSGQTSESNLIDTSITNLPLNYETLNSTKVEYFTSDQETYSISVRKEMFLIQNNKSTSASTKNTFRQTSENNLIDSTITDLPLDYETLNSTKVGYSTSNQEIYPTSVIKEISVTENYIPTSRITENTSGQTAEGNLIDTSITNLPLNYETLNLTKVEYFTIDQETYSTNARKELSLIQNNKSTSADIKNTSGPTSEKRVKDKSTTDLPLHYEILNTTTSDQETYPTGTLKEISVTENYIPTSRIIENTSGQTSECNLIDTSITNLPLNYETLNSTKVEYFTSDQETYSKSVIKEWSLIQNNKSTSADIKNTSGPTSEKRVKDKSTTDLPLHYKILNTTTSDQETYPTGTLKEISVTENYIPTSRIIENTSGQTSESNLIDTSITNLPLNYETLNSTKVEYFTSDQETYSISVRKEWSLIQNNKSTSADIKNTSGPASEKNVKDKIITNLPLDYETLNSTKVGYSTSNQEIYPTGVIKEISVTENYIPASRIIENTSGQTTEGNFIDTSITNLPLTYETLNSTKVEYFTSDQETYSTSVRKEWSLIQNNKSTSADIKNTSGPTSEKRVKDKSTTDLPLHYEILNTTTSDQETYPTGTLKEISVTENYIPTSRIIENTSGQTSEGNLIDTSITNLPLNYETLNSTKVEYFTSDQQTYSTSAIQEIFVTENYISTSRIIENTSGQTSGDRLNDTIITDIPLNYETLTSANVDYFTSDKETYSTGVINQMSLIQKNKSTITNIENTSGHTSETNLIYTTITNLPLDYETQNLKDVEDSTKTNNETFSTDIRKEISVIENNNSTSINIEKTSEQPSKEIMKDEIIIDLPLDYETLNSTTNQEAYSTVARKEMSLIQNNKLTSTDIKNTLGQMPEKIVNDKIITDLPLHYETQNSTKVRNSTISYYEIYSTGVSKEMSVIQNDKLTSTDIKNTSGQTSVDNLKHTSFSEILLDYGTQNHEKERDTTTINQETYSRDVRTKTTAILHNGPTITNIENISGQTSEDRVKDSTITDFPLNYETLNSTKIVYSTGVSKELSIIGNYLPTSTKIKNTPEKSSKAYLKDKIITGLPLDYGTLNSEKGEHFTTTDRETYNTGIVLKTFTVEKNQPTNKDVKNYSGQTSGNNLKDTTITDLPLDYETLNSTKVEDSTSVYETYFTDVITKTSAIGNIESTRMDIENTSEQRSEDQWKDATLTDLPLGYETLKSVKPVGTTTRNQEINSTDIRTVTTALENYNPTLTDIENASGQTSEDSVKDTTIIDLFLDYGTFNLTKVGDSTTGDHETYSRDISKEIFVIKNDKPMSTNIENTSGQTFETNLKEATITDSPLHLPDEEFDSEKGRYPIYDVDVTYFTNFHSEMTVVENNKPSSSALPSVTPSIDIKNSPTLTSRNVTFTEKSSNKYSSEGIESAITSSTKPLIDQEIKTINTIDNRVTEEETERTSSVSPLTSKELCEGTNTDISEYDLLISYNTTNLWGDIALTINVHCPLDQIILNFQGVSVSFSSLYEIMTITQEKLQIVALKYMDYDKQRGKILIQLTNKLTPEYSYILGLKFTSELSSLERGVTLTTFLTRSVGHQTRNRAWVIGTFMFPNFGRLVFPCILTPERRSIFHLRLNRSMGVEAVSNTLKVKTDKLSKEKLMDDFHKTPAIPISSFMFNILPNYHSFIVERTPSLAFWFPSYLKYSVEPIVKIANDILDFFIEYFQYHLPIQQISIIVREDLYSDPPASFATILISSKYLYERYERNYENKENIYHFLAKQFCDLWIGNIISFNSWNDNWIKEGFSIYMAHLATMHIYDDYDYSSFIIRIQQKAFWYHRYPFLEENNHQDGLYRNNKVKNDTPYKGAFLLHMVFNILRPQPFQEAIRFLFTEWALQSINPDTFWSSFNAIQENLDITKFINSWAFNHYPTLNVYLVNNSVIIKQVPRPGSQFDYSSWWIPINYLTGRDINYDFTITHWIKQQQSIRIKIHFNDTWIIFNPHYAGFARFNYSRKLWKMIITGLRKGTAQLPSSIKAQLLDDAFSLASDNSLDYSVPMTMALYLKSEEDYAPWFVALTHFSYLAEVLRNYPEWQIFQHYMAGIMSDVSLKLQIKKDTVAETEIQGQLRKILMAWSCLNDLSNGCDKWTLQKFLKWKDDPSSLSKNIIITELKSIIYCMGAKFYDDETSKYLYSFSKSQMITTGESLKLLRGVTCTNKFMTFMEILNDVFDINNPSFSFLRLKEFVLSLKQSHVNSLLSFRYLKHNWKSIYKRFHDSNGILDAIIEGATYFLRTKEHYKEVLTLIKSVPESDHNTLASLNIAIDQIVYNINWDIRNLDKFRKWLLFYNKTRV